MATTTDPRRLDGGSPPSTPAEFLEKLRQALNTGGDFPASAKIVTELRSLTSQPQTTANQIAEVILREPSLGVRLLHLVNSSFYRRSKPVTTISQAIIQIGMKPIADMCAGLVLLQQFVSEARQNSAFAVCLRKSITTSILASALSAKRLATASKTLSSRTAESGYLSGTLAEMGVFLMAFYFPQLYDSAVKRSEAKQQDIADSVKQLAGLSPVELSVDVIRTLNLPQFYADVVMAADKFELRDLWSRGDSAHSLGGASAPLRVAMEVSTILAEESDADVIVRKLNDLRSVMGLPPEVLQESLQELDRSLKEHCSALEVRLPPIPVDLSRITFSKTGAALQNESSDVPLDEASNTETTHPEFSAYVSDIRKAIELQEPTASVVTAIMEVCAYCLKFDRILLLLANQGLRNLVGRMMLGTIPNFEPQKYIRPLGRDANPDSPDFKAFDSKSVICEGKPLFVDGPTFAAIPVGLEQRTVGVIYADKIDGSSGNITPETRQCLKILCDLLDTSLRRMSRR
jgi:HD-like signal output (HDOD) protein